MVEQNNSFETRLQDLMAFANENKGVIDSDMIDAFFRETNPNVNQIDQVYEYLETHNIVILNLADDDPDDDALLAMEDDGELVLDAKELSAAANVMADDPVKQY